ncbi:MAG: DNA cytosine methyltransferase [Armatimonadota bacterium]|nr:DNA cytosine methyltransferase [Armatimonadota bacterium]
MQLTFIDLFAGVGGMSEGFLQARHGGIPLFRPLLLVDVDEIAAYTFQRNRPRVRYLVQDVRSLTGKDLRRAAGMSGGETLDALIGGPPCQGFSALRHNSPLDDPRNALLKEFLRLARDLEPRFILIENVKNLLHYDGGRFRDKVVAALEKMGYRSEAETLNAHQYGVPQIRERAFIAAFRSDTKIREFHFPKGKFPPLKFAKALMDDDGEPTPEILTPYISVEEAIGDLPPLQAGQAAQFYTMEPFTDYQYARRRGAALLHNHEARNHSADFLRKIARISPGASNQDLDGRRRFDRARLIKYFSQAYGRLHPNGIAYTITTHFLNPGSGRFMHYRDLRSITVREAARFQGFDDDFVFYGRVEQQQELVGNAVPPILARVLAEHFGEMLLEKEEASTLWRTRSLGKSAAK